jgi:hypothetical protein|tara:strand:- start:2579 stop:2953 length:375 start_codon:yes stop_codon:yes gene_type:complete
MQDMPKIELSEFYTEIIGLVLTLLVGLWIKDTVTSFLGGLKFKMNPHFKEGDKVLLDGQQAMIVKIGWSQSVFGIYGEAGYTWRFIPNKRIELAKLEKIVDADLHPDTKEERAKKLMDIMNNKE